MNIAIPKDQQKIFIEQFLSQVLNVALDLVSKDKDLGSPGKTIQTLGHTVIRQIYRLGDQVDDDKGDGDA